MLALSFNTTAQTVYWTGNANDGLWSTASNWSTNALPASTDNVVLDHTHGVSVGYIVRLPDVAVTVSSILIDPLVDSIKLLLPSTNILTTALTISNGGLNIRNRGIFQNSSGAPSGTNISLADSLRIYNGGKYLHNTARAHADYVLKLSKASGTERGVFHFDVPGGAAFTLSASGRTSMADSL